MTVLVAIVVTAIVVGAGVAVGVRRHTARGITRSIGGRDGADPIAEHHRLLLERQHQLNVAESRVEMIELSLDALTSGVVLVDPTGTVLFRNRLAAPSSSQAHEQALVDAATTELLATAATGQPAERQVALYGPPKRILFVQALPVAVDDKIIAALAVIDDVTEHHRIDQTRRDFISNLSHELRTPIGAVSLLAEMLDGETDPEIVENLAGRLMLETDRMANTVDDLLELSRIESDTEPYDEAVLVTPLIEEALARTRVAGEANDVSVRSDIRAAADITVIGNHDQLLSALVNLVENAIKYSDAGDAVAVEVRVESDAVVLAVRDTGRGIPARDLDRIFERFYRVDRSRDSSTGGTGIGLSIVRHVALNHGGTVSVQSQEGEGSTFTLTLPTS